MEERDYKKLRDAVIAQLGHEDEPGYTIADVFQQITEHGADTGWSGFTYHRETAKFYEDNRDAIHEMLGDLLDDMGEAPKQLLEALGQGYDYFANWMAWFALEEVARRETDEESEDDDDDDDDDVVFDDEEDE